MKVPEVKGFVANWTYRKSPFGSYFEKIQELPFFAPVFNCYLMAHNWCLRLDYNIINNMMKEREQHGEEERFYFVL